MATLSLTRRTPAHLLRLALRANAAFTAAGGAVALLGAGLLAPFLGVGEPLALEVIGIGLLLYVPLLLRAAARDPLPARTGFVFAALDALWVAASWALILAGWLPLTTEGQWLIAAQAEIVSVFAVVQFYAAWRMQ